MTKRQMLIVIEVIKQILKVSKNPDLDWPLIKIKKHLLKFKNEMDEYMEPSEEYKEYDKERVNLCQSHCEKDLDGNPKFIDKPLPGGGFQKVFAGLDNNPTFQAAHKKLKKKYKEHIDAHDTKVEHYNDVILEEVVDMEKEFEKNTSLKKIPVSLIGKNIVHGEFLEYLEPILEDDDK